MAMTEQERIAARKATYAKYNAKRYKKTADLDVLKIPGMAVKQTEKATVYLKDGRRVSQNKLKKLVPSRKELKEIKRENIIKILEHRKRYFDSREFKGLKEGKTNSNVLRTKELREASRLYTIRVDAARKSVESMAEGSHLFSANEYDLLMKHTEAFMKAAPAGERAGFWQIYEEIVGKLSAEFPNSKVRASSLDDKEKIKEMFELQLGPAYTQEFLPFLYS